MMASSKEEQAPAAAVETVEEVQQPPETKVEETKPVKEKKTRTPKEKKPKQPKTSSHPPYFQMIQEALLALNEKSGSSPYAIAKYMEEQHKSVLPSNFRKMLSLQLKNSTSRGKLIKIKASYKLSESGDNKKVASAPPRTTRATRANAEKKTTAQETKTKAKAKAKAKKPTATRKTRSVNKAMETVKKVGGGKRSKKTAGAAKPKQPKSIKSPASKRARKATAAA